MTIGQPPMVGSPAVITLHISNDGFVGHQLRDAALDETNSGMEDRTNTAHATPTASGRIVPEQIHFFAMATSQHIPSDRQERFHEVAALIEQFGQKQLDAELTGFAIELWTRVCRRKAPNCLRGKPTVWAASVIHVIARMNFLFDRAQPVHVTFDTICDYFQANKNTVGGKATEIERTFNLRQHNEPGLCRQDFLESFTNVRLSNGLVVSWRMAKQMGYVPDGVRVEDLL